MAFPQLTKQDLEQIEAERKAYLRGVLMGIPCALVIGGALSILWAALWPLARACICGGMP